MQWTKDTLKESRTAAKLSQPALAESLGVHFRTVQNWEKGTTPIPASVLPALDKLFGEAQDVVPREEYNKKVRKAEYLHKYYDLYRQKRHI